MRIDRLGHLVRIGVELGGSAVRVLVDSGIGVNVVSPSLAEGLGLRSTGASFTGRRMSGQEITAELVGLPPVVADGVRLTEQVAAVIDLGDDFDGILGLTAFDRVPFTVDAGAGTLELRGPGTDAVAVPLHLHRDGPSTDPYADLTLPDGSTVRVEVDMGSGRLILDQRLLDEGRVRVGGEIEEMSGTDETGHRWVRRFGTLAGEVSLLGAAGFAQADPPVMVQSIIHAGLVGAEYLDRFRYTFDVPGSMLWLERR